MDFISDDNIFFFFITISYESWKFILIFLSSFGKAHKNIMKYVVTKHQRTKLCTQVEGSHIYMYTNILKSISILALQTKNLA